MKAVAQSLIFSHYSVKDGLSSSSIYKIFQDSKGYIWLGTDLGVDKYDGLHFTNYSIANGLPDHDIIDIFEDSRGRIWFISIKGVVSYFYNNRIYIPHFNGVSNTGIISLAEDSKGNTWLVKNKDTICVVSPENRVIKKYITPRSVLWRIYEIAPGKMAGEWQYGLYKIKEDSIQLFHQRNDEINQVRVRSIAATNGCIVYANHEGINILKEADFANLSHGRIETDKIGVLSLMLDRNKQIWIGSREGVYICDYPGFTSQPSRWLEHKIVSSIMQDHEGNIWCGTQGDGLYFLPSLNHRIYTTQNGLLNDNITAIDGDGKGNVWAGDKEGNVYKIENGKLSVSFRNKESYLSVTSLKALSDGRLLATRTHQLLIIDRRNKVNQYDVFVNAANYFNDTLLLCSDHSGIVIVPSSRASELPKLINQREYKNIPKIKSASVKRDTLYFANRDRIYYRPPGGSLHEVALPKLDFNAAISYIIPEGNNIFWIATYGAGVYRLDQGRLRRFSAEEGLPSNFCKYLFKAPNSNVVWVATTKGAGKIVSTKQGYRVEDYSARYGTGPIEVNSLYEDKNCLWMATTSGIVRLMLNETSRPDAPQVLIEAVYVNNAQVPAYKILRLRHSENDIRINYLGLTYRHKGNFHYVYKMQGYDTSWHTTTGTSIQYTSLRSGSYTFLIKTMNAEGYQSEVAAFPFSINQAIWEEAWFLILAGIVLLGSLTGMVFLVLKTIRKRERMRYELKRKMNDLEVRALRAQMNPHFLFNSLNAIQNYIMTQDKMQATIYLAKFASLMHMIIDNSKKSSILLADELKFLQVYLELEKLRFKDKLEYAFEIDSAIDATEVNIPSMVIQPFIENALKHGLLNKTEGGHIKVCFEMKGNDICCTVEDNGIGREKAVVLAEKHSLNGTGTGISATIERLRLVTEGRDIAKAFQFIDLKDDDGNAVGSKVMLLLPTIYN